MQDENAGEGDGQAELPWEAGPRLIPGWPDEGFPEYNGFGQASLAWEDLEDRIRGALEYGWQSARVQLLNAAVISADVEVWMLTNPEQMGDPAHRIDRRLHQRVGTRIERVLAGCSVIGEEEKPNALLLDPDEFNLIGYLDALDGSRQAFSLPGGWSINVVLQRYIGVGSDGLPSCQLLLLGVVDAEGASAIWTPGPPKGVNIRLIGGGPMERGVVSDQLLVNDEDEEFGVTGQLTVLAGGYKPAWWARFKALRELLPDVPFFNTAGAPVARKVIQNSDLVVCQVTTSTLWDGVAAGLIAAAGGYVVRLGETEPLPAEHVLDWLSPFGYTRDPADPGKLTERYCVPAFIAGMAEEKVAQVALAAKAFDTAPLSDDASEQIEEA